MKLSALEHNFPWCFGNNHLERCRVNDNGSGVGGNTDSPNAVVFHRGMFQFYPVGAVLLCDVAWGGSEDSRGQTVL